jgi:hypothetical protein
MSETPKNPTLSETAIINFQLDLKDLKTNIKKNPAPKSNRYLASLASKPKRIVNGAKMRDLFPGISDKSQGGCVALPNRVLDGVWFKSAWEVAAAVKKLGGKTLLNVFEDVTIPDNLEKPEQVRNFIKQQVAKNSKKIRSMVIPKKSVITLYYTDSPSQMEAYRNGKVKNPPVISTHAAIMTEDNMIAHNVKYKGAGTVYLESLEKFYSTKTNKFGCLITGVYDVTSHRRKPQNNSKNKYKAKPKDTVWKYFKENKSSHGYRNFPDYEKAFIDKNGTTALKVDDFYTLPTKKKTIKPKVIKPEAKKNSFLRVAAVSGDTGGNFFKKYGKGMTYGQYRDWFKANNDTWEKIILGDKYKVKPNKSSNTTVIKPEAKKNSFLRVAAVSGDTGGNFFKKYGKGMTYGQYRDWFKANNDEAWQKIILGDKYKVKPNKSSNTTVIKPEAKKNGFLRVAAVSGDTGGNFFKKYGKGMTYGQYRDWFKANNDEAWQKIILGTVYKVRPNKSAQKPKPVTPPKVVKPTKSPVKTKEIKKNEKIIHSNLSRADALKNPKVENGFENLYDEIEKRQKVVSVDYYNFAGQLCQGQVVIDKLLAPDVRAIFRKARNIKFPIAQMIPVSQYGFDDDVAMAKNAGGAFNFRRTASGSWSHHAAGLALDVNQRLNPYFDTEKSKWVPVGISNYNIKNPGAFHDGKPHGSTQISQSAINKNSAGYQMVKYIKSLGWKWGGKRFNDYHHFYKMPSGYPEDLKRQFGWSH